MANEYTAEVVKYLRRKEGSEFEPVTWIGAEQRFVGPLRNSAINNLEEQYVFGTDTYTIEYKDNENNDIVEKSYCITTLTNTEDQTNYYKVVSTIYPNTKINDDYKLVEDKIVFSNALEDVVFGNDSLEYPDENCVYLINKEPTFSFVNDDTLLIVPATFSELGKEELYFIQPDGTELLVLTKSIGEKYTLDGKHITHEKITNIINPSA